MSQLLNLNSRSNILNLYVILNYSPMWWHCQIYKYIYATSLINIFTQGWIISFLIISQHVYSIIRLRWVCLFSGSSRGIISLFLYSRLSLIYLIVIAGVSNIYIYDN